jgi:hypothetical protein
MSTRSTHLWWHWYGEPSLQCRYWASRSPPTHNHRDHHFSDCHDSSGTYVFFDSVCRTSEPRTPRIKEERGSISRLNCPSQRNRRKCDSISPSDFYDMLSKIYRSEHSMCIALRTSSNYQVIWKRGHWTTWIGTESSRTVTRFHQCILLPMCTHYRLWSLSNWSIGSFKRCFVGWPLPGQGYRYLHNSLPICRNHSSTVQET